MITKNLEVIMEEIAQQMCESVSLNPYDDNSPFSFFYEEHGYCIEGSGRVGGQWFDDGDGYWTPREYYLKYGWGSLTELSIVHYDEETDEETTFPNEVVKDIRRRLDLVLSDYMKNY